MKFSRIFILLFFTTFVLSEDVNYEPSTGLVKPAVPTFTAPSETYNVSVPAGTYNVSLQSGTPIIPGLLPGMTAIPTISRQDIAARNAELFTLDNLNPNRDVEGALVETFFKSTIGVLLDEFSESFGIREKVANYYLGQSDDFWFKKAQMQTKFTEHRQAHRVYYYFNKKQLTLPPEQVWEFNLGKAYRTKIGVHDYIAVDVDFYSVLVTNAKTINTSEPALNIIDGKWSDHWILPVDPEFLLQKTGFACIDKSYTLTVESENIWAYYNDSCETEPQPTSEYPAICCADVLNQNVGFVNVTITWHRIPYTENVAKKYRFGNHSSTFSDLVGIHKNLLEETRVAYRYHGRNSCELHEQCIGEYTSLNALYDTCAYQGISAGWGDDYRAGLACQWVDVTGLPAQTALLGYVLNPEGIGFQVQDNTIECTPGENVTLGFYLQESKQTPSVTVRICESSRVLGSTHCEYVYALANTIVELSSNESNPAKVTFKCPIARDNIETGGLYSILVAPTFIEDKFMFVNIVTCK
ncbi:hypothetical protein C2G38_2281493 [Gigaspora rosea]|uniref:Uncharacterized protein n=1 Tax=Gigaspora rosea TaxID=44941 RepID=A0A397UCZ3_9GLOM|nr:hypothetical protein C2G38_2281493 [Gigaspora rosea]